MNSSVQPFQSLFDNIREPHLPLMERRKWFLFEVIQGMNTTD
jgi:hypothetical protein